MVKHITKRILLSIPLIIGITFISFMIIQLSPGDFFSLLKLNPQISPEVINLMKQEFGVDKNIFYQYMLWFINLFKFKLGYSFLYKVPVSFLIKTRLFNTFILSLTSMVIAWCIAVPLGLFSALKKNSFFDKSITLFAIASVALPTFFFGLILIFLSAKTGLFPLGGKEALNIYQMGVVEKTIDLLRHLFLPALVLSVVTAGPLTRILRSSAIEVMSSEYVLAARARGLKENRILFVHILRNSINPLITIMGYQLSALLSGAAFVEIIFSWPGLGRLMLDAVLAHDIYLIMGNLLISACLLLAGNLVADVLLRVSDPRIS